MSSNIDDFQSITEESKETSDAILGLDGERQQSIVDEIRRFTTTEQHLPADSVTSSRPDRETRNTIGYMDGNASLSSK